MTVVNETNEVTNSVTPPPGKLNDQQIKAF